MRVRAWLACANTCYTGTAFTGLVLSIDQCLLCFITYGSSHPSFSFLILWNLVNRPTKFKKKKLKLSLSRAFKHVVLGRGLWYFSKRRVYRKTAKVKSWYWDAPRHRLDRVHQGSSDLNDMIFHQIYRVYYFDANFSTLFIKFTFCLFMGLFHSITFILM